MKFLKSFKFQDWDLKIPKDETRKYELIWYNNN